MNKLLIIITLGIVFNTYAQQWSPITNNNIWNLNSGNIGIGITNPQSKLDVNGEIRSTLTGISNLRLVSGGYAALLRNDGVNTYLLFTNNNDVNGGWNNLRPLRINNSNGDIFIANENVAITHSTGNLGVGISNPQYKLDVNGPLFLRSTEVINGWNHSHLFWEGHSLVMGTPAGAYAYNSVDLKPGGVSQEPLSSQLRMYTSTNTNQHTLNIQLNSNGNCFFNNPGNVGIGTINPYYKLDVQGVMRAHEVRVNLNSGADFVFENDYELMPLSELLKFISKNKHLPEIPSAKEMTEGYTDLGVLQIKLLQKIEELTLYVIELNREIQTLKERK
ncbi:MAG: hypothetical protein Q7U47_14365 [Paludibacter sp.]|nr:hypothetical protein [Paludibacter sp.]